MNWTLVVNMTCLAVAATLLGSVLIWRETMIIECRRTQPDVFKIAKHPFNGPSAIFECLLPILCIGLVTIFLGFGITSFNTRWFGWVLPILALIFYVVSLAKYVQKCVVFCEGLFVE